MPNFFKKLTGSFKMNEEDDIFNDDKKPASAQVPAEKSEGTEETSQDETLNEESLPTYDDDIDDVAEEPTGEIPEEGAEGPYTIAQLAQAQTARKRGAPNLSRKKEAPISIYSKGGTAEGDSNMPEGQLAIDVYETPAEIVIKSTIAGAKPADLDVGIEDNTVNIRGSRHNEENIKGENYLYQECYWGTFSRSIILPTEVDSDKAEASLKDGVLTIRIPKIVREKEKKIKIL